MKDAGELAAEVGIPLRVLRRLASQPLSFYRYRRIRTGKKVRKLTIPMGDMLSAQRAIKKNILDLLPLPPYVHGWRRGRSPKTYAKVHLRQGFILNVDIRDFYPSVEAGRVHEFWRGLGYTQEAARLLALTTTINNQLPQGAPTSQSIGNQILLPLHRRLSVLAARHGLRYGAYGDEVCLSGRRRVRRLKGLVIRIIEQEGFDVNPKKVKEMPRESRQELTGVVVNKKPSAGRAKYRELRALLNNCATKGPESQNTLGHPNFKAHLRGRIAHVQGLNPKLGAKLKAQFEKIQWPSAPSGVGRPPSARGGRP